MIRTRVERIFHEVVELSPNARSRYFTESNVDDTTRREVELLLAFDTPADVVLEQQIGDVAQSALSGLEPQALPCGPYRLGELVGSGGVGAVYIGERADGEVAHKVAIKLLRPGVDSPALRQRFLAERRILATLSHPNIAQLYDAGHREDGQPYLVMEYVDGSMIDQYAAGLGVRRTLALFLKVCGAVAYLHRNLIVHRDLKPSNILVTLEGEPKLLDFGIAKMLDSSADVTVTASRMLTPEYASPEQLAGRAVTTASDVYSLAAVLYKLLTGESPHEFGDDAGVFADRRVAPPSNLPPHIKGDLQAIVLKGLRSEPQERYPSVEQFAEDLENYLESRPIRARKGDAWYRVRKFVTRYRLPILAGSIAVAGLCSGIIVANQERLLAQRRFVQVRQLANKLYDIDEEVRRTPGTTNARVMIVNTSLEYLQALAGDVKDDPALALELGNAYMRLARVQGVPVNSNLGNAEQADRSLEHAEGLLRAALISRSNDRTAMLRSAQTAHDRMILAAYRGDSDLSLAFARTSAQWLAKYERSGPVDRHEAEQIAVTYNNVGTTFVNHEQYDEAIRLSWRAFEIARSAGFATQSGAALMSLAEAYRRKGDLDEALRTIREAVGVLQRRDGALERGQTKTLLNALSREGRILGEDDVISMRNYKEAIRPLAQAFEIAQAGILEDPGDADIKGYAGTAGLVYADVLQHTDATRALRVYDQTLSTLAQIPHNPRARSQEVFALARSTYALRRLGRDAEARRRLDTALARLGALKLYPAERIYPTSEPDAVLSAIADYEAGRGDPRRASDICEELLRKVSATQPQPETSLTDAVSMSRLYSATAGLDRRIGQSATACARQNSRVQLWKHWDAKLPHNSFVRRELELAERTVDQNGSSGIRMASPRHLPGVTYVSSSPVPATFSVGVARKRRGSDHLTR